MLWKKCQCWTCRCDAARRLLLPAICVLLAACLPLLYFKALSLFSAATD
jgi:hypothetical protein